MKALSLNMTANAAAITTEPANDLSPVLFNDFIEFIDRSEKTVKTYVTNLKQFAAYLRYKAIARPIRKDVISYRDWLKSEHEAIQLDPQSETGWRYQTDKNGNRKIKTCKPNTVKLYLQSVKQFFSWTAASGFYPNIAANVHTDKVKQDFHRKDALKAAEANAIKKSIEANAANAKNTAAANKKDTAGRINRATEQGKRLYAMYLLTVTAGLRTIELHRANVKDIEVKNGQAVLWIWGKGHAEPDQKKPLAPATYEAISDYLSSRSDDPTGNSPLFVSTGNRSGGKRIAVTTISKMLKKAMQAAGFNSERLTAHSLRHSAAQAALKVTDKNIYEVQNYMRHVDPKTTEIYLHEDEESQNAEIETANKIYDYLFAD